jgi:hypothetical protein
MADLRVKSNDPLVAFMEQLPKLLETFQKEKLIKDAEEVKFEREIFLQNRQHSMALDQELVNAGIFAQVEDNLKDIDKSADTPVMDILDKLKYKSLKNQKEILKSENVRLGQSISMKNKGLSSFNHGARAADTVDYNDDGVFSDAEMDAYFEANGQDITDPVAFKIGLQAGNENNLKNIVARQNIEKGKMALESMKKTHTYKGKEYTKDELDVLIALEGLESQDIQQEKAGLELDIAKQTKEEFMDPEAIKARKETPGLEVDLLESKIAGQGYTTDLNKAKLDEYTDPEAKEIRDKIQKLKVETAENNQKISDIKLKYEQSDEPAETRRLNKKLKELQIDNEKYKQQTLQLELKEKATGGFPAFHVDGIPTPKNQKILKDTFTTWKGVDTNDLLAMLSIPQDRYADLVSGAIDFSDIPAIESQMEKQIVTLLKEQVLSISDTGLTIDDVNSLYGQRSEWTAEVSKMVDTYVHYALMGLNQNPAYKYKDPESVWNVKQPELTDLRAQLGPMLDSMGGLLFRDKQSNQGLDYQLIEGLESQLLEAGVAPDEEKLKVLTDLVYQARTPQAKEQAFLTDEVRAMLTATGEAGGILTDEIYDILDQIRLIESLNPTGIEVVPGAQERETEAIYNNLRNSIIKRTQ